MHTHTPTHMYLSMHTIGIARHMQVKTHRSMHMVKNTHTHIGKLYMVKNTYIHTHIGKYTWSNTHTHTHTHRQMHMVKNAYTSTHR